MSVNFGTYSFEGPIIRIDDVKHKPGVCIVVDNVDGKYEFIDIFSSTDLKTKLVKHDHRIIWKNVISGRLEYCIYYTTFNPTQQKNKHLEIETELRNAFDFMITKPKSKKRTIIRSDPLNPKNY